MSDLNVSIENHRRDKSALLAELEALGVQNPGAKAIRCCFHGEDKHPSAWTYQREDGAWAFHCGTCAINGDVFDLRGRRLQRSRDDVVREFIAAAKRPAPPRSRPLPPASAPSPAVDWPGRARAAFGAVPPGEREALAAGLGLSADALARLGVGLLPRADLRRLVTGDRGCTHAFTFPMCDAAGVVIGLRLRFSDHSKGCVTGSGSGLFVPATLTGRGPLFIVEGPTDAAAVLDLGFDAIGRPNNTSGQEMVVDYVRRQPRPVVIVHQRDKPGVAERTEQAARNLAAALSAIAPSVRVLGVPSPHKDLRDWKRAGMVSDELEAAADEAEAAGPASDLRRLFEAIIDGSYAAVPWPFPMLDRGTAGLTPGSVSILAGDPGGTKSFLLLQAAAAWHAGGVRVALLELEKDRAFHLRRAIAQRSGCPMLTNLDWIRSNHAEAERLRGEFETWADDFGRCIFDTKGIGSTLPKLAAWVEQQAAAGVRVIVIDPITLAEAGRDRFVGDEEFMRRAKDAIEKHGASLVLVTHPAKGKRSGQTSLDDLAGGAVYGRAADAVLWIARHEDGKTVAVRAVSPDDDGVGALMPVTRIETIDRTVKILKARESRGGGWAIGYRFDRLTFTEAGLIVKTPRGGESESASA